MKRIGSFISLGISVIFKKFSSILISFSSNDFKLLGSFWVLFFILSNFFKFLLLLGSYLGGKKRKDPLWKIFYIVRIYWHTQPGLISFQVCLTSYAFDRYPLPLIFFCFSSKTDDFRLGILSHLRLFHLLKPLFSFSPSSPLGQLL